jgi:hypothetical protein
LDTQLHQVEEAALLALLDAINPGEVILEVEFLEST